MADQRPLGGLLDDGQTPLDPDESRGLIPAWIATRGDLNDAEAANIVQGLKWADRQIRRKATVVPTDDFLRKLHQRMFDQVWTWAGQFRATERNIGVAPHQVAMQIRQLMDDVAAWQQYGTYEIDERAARLHHRLTFIHPFANGNGRSSRVMADLFLRQNDAQPFTWGAGLPDDGARACYLAAIRQADAGDLGPLLAFVRN